MTPTEQSYIEKLDDCIDRFENMSNNYIVIKSEHKVIHYVIEKTNLDGLIYELKSELSALKAEMKAERLEFDCSRASELAKKKVGRRPKPFETIEGFYIENEWKKLPDYPEPPDEKMIIQDRNSRDEWRQYRELLGKFSYKHRLLSIQSDPYYNENDKPVMSTDYDKEIIPFLSIIPYLKNGFTISDKTFYSLESIKKAEWEYHNQFGNEKPVMTAEEVLSSYRGDYVELTGMSKDAERIILQAINEYHNQLK